VRTIEAAAGLEACSARMADEGVRRLPVTIGDEITGIISDSDILAAVIGHRWRGHRRLGVPATAIVADVMQPAPTLRAPLDRPTLSPELSIWQAADRMARAGVARLAVTRDGEVIGIVHQADILQALEERGAPD
jgi:CBS domain-containing protein